MDRIDEWRLFTAVARLSSFSKAARLHGVSPQAATRAISAIEQRIGVRLLHRTTRSVTLTVDGRRYVERGTRAVAELDALESSASVDPVVRGTVAITAPVLFGQLRVAPIVRELLKRHAAVSARLLLLDRVVALADEGVDIAIRIGRLPDSALRVRKLGSVRRVVCASPRYLAKHGTPRRPADLADHACIDVGEAAARWSFPGRHSVAVRSRLVVNDVRTGLEAAVAGLGLVRVLSYQLEIARSPLVVVLEDHEPEPLPVQLVQPAGLASRAVAAFVELAAAALQR